MHPYKRSQRLRILLREEIADSLSLSHEPDDPDEGVGVPEAGVDAVRVALRYEPLFVELHGEGHRVASGHGVYPVLVAELVSLHDRAEVIDPAVGPEESDGLELGPGPRSGP